MDAKSRVCRRALQLCAEQFPNLFECSNLTIGYGSGSTVEPLLSMLLDAFPQCELNLVPTSYQSRALIARGQGNFRLSFLDDSKISSIQLTVDGADIIDLEEGVILKGGGAAHCMEKIVASQSERYIIVATDKEKKLKSWRSSSVPVEVLPGSWTVISKKISELWPAAISKLREAKPGCGKIGPVVTDNGNFILDISGFPVEESARNAHQKLKLLTGVVETGFFLNLPDGQTFAVVHGEDSDPVEVYSIKQSL